MEKRPAVIGYAVVVSLPFFVVLCHFLSFFCFYLLFWLLLCGEGGYLIRNFQFLYWFHFSWNFESYKIMAMYIQVFLVSLLVKKERKEWEGGGAFSRGALVFYYGLRGKALIWGSSLTGVNMVYHHYSVDWKSSCVNLEWVVTYLFHLEVEWGHFHQHLDMKHWWGIWWKGKEKKL